MPLRLLLPIRVCSDHCRHSQAPPTPPRDPPNCLVIGTRPNPSQARALTTAPLPVATSSPPSPPSSPPLPPSSPPSPPPPHHPHRCCRAPLMPPPSDLVTAARTCLGRQPARIS